MPAKSDRKRTATSSEPSTSGENRPKEKKRTRFASPDSDSATFEEQVDATLEDPTARRRGVKTEGYESDSSDDGEGVVASRKKTDTQAENDDDDMFAVGEKNDAEDQKRSKEFLRLGDIEGQEFGDEKMTHESDETSSENEPEDEDEAERRKKLGMGYELSSFNMREEMEEGKFDADGTFLRTFDPHGVHDRWMDGVDERAIKKARRVKKLRERQEREKIKKEEKEAIGKEDAEKELVGYLRKGETVLEALQRLGIAVKKVKNKRPPTKKSLIRIRDDSQQPITTDPSPIQDSITRITDLASTLMSLGNTDIYSFQYEQLLRSVRRTSAVPPDWVPESQSAQYEYCWALEEQGRSQQGEQVYGPYRPEEMLTWHGAKYFGDEGEKIRVRKLGENDWHEWNEIMF